MLVTFDTEDPKLIEMLVQFLRGHFKQRMIAMFGSSRVVHVPSQDGLTTQRGYFIQDGDVEIARMAAHDIIKVKGARETFVELMTKDLLGRLLAYANPLDEVTPAEQCAYMNSLIEWISQTIKTGDPNAIDAIRSLWDGESWEVIQEKLLTDASVWHVWWMDGVRRYIAIDRGWLPNGDSPGISKPEEAHGPHNHQQE